MKITKLKHCTLGVDRYYLSRDGNHITIIPLTKKSGSNTGDAVNVNIIYKNNKNYKIKKSLKKYKIERKFVFIYKSSSSNY